MQLLRRKEDVTVKEGRCNCLGRKAVLTVKEGRKAVVTVKKGRLV